MQNNLWEEGFDLMLYGMGTVFVFLTLLVIGTVIMSAIINGYFYQEPELTPEPAVVGNTGTPVSGKTLAIIQAAIHAHRAKQKH